MRAELEDQQRYVVVEVPRVQIQERYIVVTLTQVDEQSRDCDKISACEKQERPCEVAISLEDPTGSVR